MKKRLLESLTISLLREIVSDNFEGLTTDEMNKKDLQLKALHLSYQQIKNSLNEK